MIRILVSSSEISDNKIGSWTQRMTSFATKYSDFFSFYLGPTIKDDPKYIYCKKRSISRISKISSWFSNPLYRASDYLTKFKRIVKISESIQVLVMDDIMLLAGFAMLKSKGYKFQLIYSFHGHSFKTTGTWMNQVDKVLFLTQLGYYATKNNHQEFIPEVDIIGNGVDSTSYFPLSLDEKNSLKQRMGYNSEQIILTWLSNDRPKKGLHLFLKLIRKLLQKYPTLHFQIIGNSKQFEYGDPRVSSLGRLPNKDLPKYLQMSDIYCFTSLWEEGFGLTLAEAAKCGNVIVAANNGGIPEVVKELEFSFLVDSPNILKSWEKQLEQAIQYLKLYKADFHFLNNFHCLENWERRFIQALES